MSSSRTPRVLVVYYSRTGNTALLAKGLARATEGDIEMISVMTPRSGFFGYLFSGFEATFQLESRILPPRRNPRDYDIVLIGSPIWNGAMSTPVRAYLERVASGLPNVGFFVTSGGGEDKAVLEQMAMLAGKEPLGVLGMRERDLKGRFAVYLGEFWETVISAWERQTAPAAAAPVA